jgi:hypothetical protein
VNRRNIDRPVVKDKIVGRVPLSRSGQITAVSQLDERGKTQRRDRRRRVAVELGTSAVPSQLSRRRISSQPRASSRDVGAELSVEVAPCVSQAEAIHAALQKRLDRAQAGFDSAGCDLPSEIRNYVTDTRMRLGECVVVAEQLTYLLTELVASKPTASETAIRRGTRRRKAS